MDIARSTCLNELMWLELWFIDWRFVESQRVDVALEHATMSRSHGSLRTMKLSLQISVTPPALTCMLCGRGVVLKSAPSSGSTLYRWSQFHLEFDLAVQIFPRFGPRIPLLRAGTTPSVQLVRS